jgi:hypothetical protein
MDSETQHGYRVLADISGNTCRMEQPPRRATHASATAIRASLSEITDPSDSPNGHGDHG